MSGAGRVQRPEEVPLSAPDSGARSAESADVPEELAGAAGHRGAAVERPDGAGGLTEGGAESGAVDELSAGALGVERLGERATLVQFSTAFCQPCRAARRTLGEVSAMVEGVSHIEVDAESHLELVRALGVTGTPTVLVLDGAGRVVRRAVGAPRRADVIAALGAAIG